MKENRLRWYRNVLRRLIDDRRVEMISVIDTRRGSGKPKTTLIEIINKDLNILSLTKHMILYRSQRPQKVHIADPE